jgi:hypothetical protein
MRGSLRAHTGDRHEALAERVLVSELIEFLVRKRNLFVDSLDGREQVFDVA